MQKHSILDPVDGHMDKRLIRQIMMNVIKTMKDVEFLGLNRGRDADRFNFRADEIKIVSLDATYSVGNPAAMVVVGERDGLELDVHDPKLFDNIAGVIRAAIKHAKEYKVEVVFNRNNVHVRPKKYFGK
jgi:hypothetical protein